MKPGKPVVEAVNDKPRAEAWYEFCMEVLDSVNLEVRYETHADTLVWYVIGGAVYAALAKEEP